MLGAEVKSSSNPTTHIYAQPNRALTMMASTAKDELVEILKSRNLPIPYEQLDGAFADASSARTIGAWMREYACPATLLTATEASL